MAKQQQQNRPEPRRQPTQPKQTPPNQERRQRDETPSEDELEGDVE